MSEKSIFDMWIEGRFGYALPALKISIGTLVSMILMNILMWPKVLAALKI